MVDCDRTRKTPPTTVPPASVVGADIAVAEYDQFLSEIAHVLDAARRASARSVNAIMTATYWDIGRRMVEFEQGGKVRAGYGQALLERLSGDLTQRFGRGFGVDNLQRFRLFYVAYPPSAIHATLSRNSDAAQGPAQYAPLPRIFPQENPKDTIPSQGPSLGGIAQCFPLPWSVYVRLLSVKNKLARNFYETEALRGGWSVRQLDRQINAQFYERAALSKNKAAMLAKGQRPLPEDAVTPEEEIKDPYVFEFLDLKDEYSEDDLEGALIQHLETFLLELGGDFCFIGRQKRLRIGDEWYRVDLLFFHRRLRCLIVIDLKLGKFTHADAGQMHLYLNYAAEYWMRPDENPPVGLILCTRKEEALAKYALDNLPNKVLAAEYKTVLPNEQLLARELEQTRRILDAKQSSYYVGAWTIVNKPVVKATTSS